MKENSEVYLARIVSFYYPDIIFNRDNVDECIEEEIFRLVIIKNDWAYDFIDYKKRYLIVTNADSEIDDRKYSKIKPNRYYVYKYWPIVEMWESVNKVYGITASLDEILEKTVDVINQLDKLLQPDNKVIDLNKVKKLMIIANSDNK